MIQNNGYPANKQHKRRNQEGQFKKLSGHPDGIGAYPERNSQIGVKETFFFPGFPGNNQSHSYSRENE